MTNTLQFHDTVVFYKDTFPQTTKYRINSIATRSDGPYVILEFDDQRLEFDDTREEFLALRAKRTRDGEVFYVDGHGDQYELKYDERTDMGWYLEERVAHHNDLHRF